MSAALHLEQLLAQLGSSVTRGHAFEKREQLTHKSLSLDWPELDAVLPDGGFPEGVVELSAPYALGFATSIALTAVRAAHAKDARAWCAWIDPEETLYAPGVARGGVDLSRLLVVRPPREELGRVAVKTIGSHAFDVVVIDMDPVRGSTAQGAQPSSATNARVKKKRAWAPELLVRKLALFADDAGTTVILISDSNARRAIPWPVALRLDLTREDRSIAVRVAKDRRGRIGPVKTISIATRPYGKLVLTG